PGNELRHVPKGRGHGSRYAVLRDVRVGMHEAIDRAVPSRVDVRLDAIPRTEEIRMDEIQVQHHALQAGVAHAAAEAARQSFLDVELDIDEILRARDRD